MADRQMIFDWPRLRSDRWHPDTFLISNANQEAVRWLERWPQWPAPALIAYGPAGCGKTHMVSWFRARTAAVQLSPGALAAIDPHAMAARSKLCVIEDADRLAGLPMERALLHLYNCLAAADGRLLLTARQPPKAWPLQLADLRSRLQAAPTAAILAPDDALLEALLIKLFRDHQLAIDDDVVTYLLPRIERSFATLPPLVDQLDRASLTAGRRLTVPFVRQVLGLETAQGEQD